MGRLPTEKTATAIVVDPAQPQRVYAGNRAGVYRSDDAGQTWESASEGLGDQDITSIALDPSQPLRLFAITERGAMSISEDGAGSWRPLGSDPRAAG